MDIFVFGSNLAGRHGKGAAKFAIKEHGAIYGQGEGLQGQSYAIPTKDRHLRTLSLIAIECHVNTFIEHVKKNPKNTYCLTPIGTGLAGYEVSDIRPLFPEVLPKNIILTNGW